MQDQLRVDTAAVQAMASGWGVLVSELDGLEGPVALGSCLRRPMRSLLERLANHHDADGGLGWSL